MRYSLLLSLVIVFGGCGGTPEEEVGQTDEAQNEVLHGNPLHSVKNQAGPSKNAPNVTDHGGPVKGGTFHLYTIYWGSGFSSTTESLYTSFLSGLGGSGYWAINTQYLRGAANNTTFVKSYDDPSTPPATVTDAALQAEVHKVLTTGGLPADPSGLYYVLTPKNVKVCSGRSCSCTSFCGYHSNYTDSSYGTVLYSTIPSASACPSACSMFASDATSPHGNLEADSGVSILAHEGEETQSDALGTAWFDRSGNENADKCAWKYGPTTKLNGAAVNQSIGNDSWLVQMNWSNKNSGCMKSTTDGPYTQ
jgi:hypothetical protein